MTVAEYNQTVEEYSDGLYRFMLKNTGNSETARDIVQESFEKLWRRVNEVAFEKSKSYLFTTAYHNFIDILRKEKRFAGLESLSPNSPSVEKEYTGLKELLDNAVNRLPPDQKSVILLRDYEGCSYAEIADITGLSETQVRVYIFRGRQFLKQTLGSVEALI